MANYFEMSRKELAAEKAKLEESYKKFQDMGLKLNMARGKPGPHQMDLAMGLLQMILAAIVMVINQKFFISGFKSLWHRAPNMDTLVALGSMASFVWSVIALFLMTDAQLHGDMEGVMRYMD